MPRKPFEALGPHNLVCDCHAKADAAIAQDKEYALRRIREENHEGMIYYRERDEARAERDALRADNARQAEEWRKARVENCALREEVAAQQREIERLKAHANTMAAGQIANVNDAVRASVQLAEALKEIERLKSELATR